MGRPYGDELRRKFLRAYDEGEGTLEELAERFLVSVGWGRKYPHSGIELARRSGSLIALGASRMPGPKLSKRFGVGSRQSRILRYPRFN